MKVIHGLDCPDSDTASAGGGSLTIGNFDGVHRGHREIIARARSAAGGATGAAAQTVVLTFEPHPLSVVAPAKAPPRLTPLPEKLDQLAAAGAEVAVVAKANRDLLGLTPQQFIERVVGRIQPRHIVEGASFGFGRGRSGTIETLRQLGREYGFEVVTVDTVRVEIDRETTVEVSSSIIRRLIAEGQTEQAALCLGRPYALMGKVVAGTGRGKRLGFPTANMTVADQLIPADGVYAGFASTPSRRLSPAVAAKRTVHVSSWPAAISIGTTPTFENSDSRHRPKERQIEAHLLDADTDLYGREIRLEFGRWLRGQEKFASAAALIDQIARDVEAVRRSAADS